MITLQVLDRYRPDSKLGMHVDKCGSERGVPVVSFSIGDTCDFVWKRSWAKKEKLITIQLKSGDALIFGGPAEGIVHSVPRIYANSVNPSFDWSPGRLNVTIRDHAN